MYCMSKSADIKKDLDNALKYASLPFSSFSTILSNIFDNNGESAPCLVEPTSSLSKQTSTLVALDTLI